jgi:hypothetical protein
MISVKLRKATLDLELTGLEPLSRTRLGEPLRELAVTEKQATNAKTVASGKVAAHAGISLTELVPANLRLSADAAIEAKVTVTTTSKADVSEYRVKARPGDTWEVSEPLLKTASGRVRDTQPVLDGTYLEDQTLCQVKQLPGANMLSVGLSASAKQRDIALDLTTQSFRHNFVNTSQKKLFNILIARSLGFVGPKYAGIVKLSSSEIEIED